MAKKRGKIVRKFLRRQLRRQVYRWVFYEMLSAYTRRWVRTHTQSRATAGQGI